MECPNSFLNPALCHVVFLGMMKQGTVCGGFPFYRLNPSLGEGCAQRDLEERHGEQLGVSGKLQHRDEKQKDKVAGAHRAVQMDKNNFVCEK